MISTSDFRNGLIIIFKNELYQISEFQHVNPGKGSAFVRTKLKNYTSGRVIEHTFRSGDKVKSARVESRGMKYLYSDENHYYFMDNETYEQAAVPPELMTDTLKYLKEDMEVVIQIYEEKPIGVTPPTFVELRVKETEPGVKGDTATGATKSATLETGYSLQVPLFINEGDILKIDTRTGAYMGR